MMVTLREIAKECGVSAMTVSAVLNNKRGAASTETRSRILSVARDMGYIPASGARVVTAPSQDQDTLAVIYAAEDWNALATARYFGPLLDGMILAAKHHGQKLLLITEDHWDIAYEKMDSYMEQCVGLILMLPLLSNERLLNLVDRKIPFIAMGESRDEPRLTVADLDNVEAGYSATSYLLQVGHRKIAHLTGERFLLSSSQREEGYRRALVEWGMAVEESLIRSGSYSPASGYRLTRELFGGAQTATPTAIFCGDDAIAFGAMQAITELGLRIPEEVSVIGVNNDREYTHSAPGLTTVDHPLRIVGNRALNALIAQVKHGREPGEKVLLRGEIVMRGSVASPAGTTIVKPAEYRS